MAYIVRYCENHYFSDFEGGFYGGGCICTLIENGKPKQFEYKWEAKKYAEEHKWEWDKCKLFDNKEYEIVEVKEESRTS